VSDSTGDLNLREIRDELAELNEGIGTISRQLGRLVQPQRIQALLEVIAQSEQGQGEWGKLRSICMVHLKEAVEELSSDLLDENGHVYLDEHVAEVKKLSEEIALLRGFGLPQPYATDEKCE